MLLHLPRQVLAGTCVGEVQPILIEQHGLMTQPIGPGLFADVLENPLAQFAGVRRKIQPFGVLAELDAMNGSGHREVLYCLA